MKQIVIKSYLAVVTLVALALSACSSDYEYTGALTPANQVYFNGNQASTIEVSKQNSSFNITINRVGSEGSLTVPLTFTADEGNIYTVPTSVTFADGATTAPVTITYNPDDVQYGTYVGGTISVSGTGIDTTYGLASFKFAAGATEWADIETNGSIGSYREDMLTTWYSLDNVVYDVKIQKSVVNEGMYRLVNPYGKAFPYNEDGDYDTSKDYYWVINATDPDYVYFESFNSGMAWSYGEFFFTSYVAYYMAKGTPLETIKSSKPEWFGTLKDGIITMPAKTMLESMANYNSGGLYYGNTNGMLAVALPGYVIADYTVTGAYSGRFTDASENDFAQFTLTLAEDVAAVKYALIPATGNVDATVQGIIDGSIESGEATASGDVRVAYDGTGKYILVVVIYNSAGEAVGSTTVEIKLVSSKDGVETFNDVAAGTLTIGSKDLSSMVSSSGAWGLCFENAITTEAVLSQSTKDATKFHLTYLQEDLPLEFTMDASGNITFEDVEVYKGSSITLLATDMVTNFGASSNTGAALTNYGYNSHYDSSASTYYFNLFYKAGGSYYGCQQDVFEVTATAAKALKTAVNKARKAAATKNKRKMNGTKHYIREITKSVKPANL